MLLLCTSHLSLFFSAGLALFCEFRAVELMIMSSRPPGIYVATLSWLRKEVDPFRCEASCVKVQVCVVSSEESCSA